MLPKHNHHMRLGLLHRKVTLENIKDKKKKVKVQGFNNTQLQQTYKELAAMGLNSYEELKPTGNKTTNHMCVSETIFGK